MKKVEIILVAIFTLGLLLMLFSFPGQNILMILGMGFLALLYTVFGFALLNDIRFRNIFKKESYHNISTMRMLGSIAAGFSLGIALDGILFKIMFWTGSFVLLSDGIVFLFIITIIGAIKYSKTKALYYRNLFKRTITVSVVAMFLFFMPIETLVNFRYRNNPTYAKILLKTFQHPDNIEYRKELQNERRKEDPTLNSDSE